MYLTYCEREVKGVSLKVIQSFIFSRKFLKRFHTLARFLNMVSEENRMNSTHYKTEFNKENDILKTEKMRSCILRHV